jgi:hypothetical protein
VPLASVEDVRRWIAEDKLQVDEANVQPFQIEAERLIKATLSGVFSATVLVTWVDPDTTPPLISSIAGKLIAAYIYREAYSEDESTVPPYAQSLYSEAVNDLMNVRRGTLVLIDADDVVITNEDQTTSADFYPNDTAPEPKFSMEKSFG